MGKITSELLQKVAPKTPVELLDRFVPYMNEALPRYRILNELQVAGFLATAAFESMYFQRTKEVKCRPTSEAWIKYQSKYWPSGYFGRGIFQTSLLPNYRKFGQKMKERGRVADGEIFVKHPELLEQPEWAVESACEYWVTNNLDQYASQGFKGFAALEGRVNRGDAGKIALGEGDRLIIYKAARLALPDDFKLDSSATTVSTEQDPQTPVAGGPSPNDAPTGGPSSPQEQPSPTIKRGTRGPIVVLIQDHLIALGYSLKADGEFGPATESLVKRFQRSKGLAEDGMVGPATRRALGI